MQAEPRECGCGDCACGKSGEPALMGAMMTVLGIDGLVTGEARAEAAARCADCTNRDDCRDWLDVASLAGADHTPGFCRNGETFDRLASEVPAGL